MQPARERSNFFFGPFTLDVKAGELRKHGIRLGLESQPFQVLEILLERRGEVVTREELASLLWPGNAVIDSDGALSTAIRKIRAALLDSVANPQYIETLPKRGYRFIGAITSLQPAPQPLPEPVLSPLSEQPPSRRLPARTLWLIGAMVLAGVLIAGLSWSWWTSSRLAPRVLRYVQLTSDGLPKDETLVTDGVWLYFGELGSIVQLSIAGGHPYPLLSGWATRAISPAGDQILAFPSARTTEADLPLSSIVLPGGTPFDLGIRGHDGAWSPDGERLAFANGDSLYIAANNGAGARKVATALGWMGEATWSPDGSRIRFGVRTPTGQRTLEEVATDGHSRTTLAGPSSGLEDYRGAWAPDDRYFVFERQAGKLSNLWAMRENRGLFGKVTREFFQLTDGPVSFSQPVMSRDGRKIIAIGRVARAELMRYDPGEHRFLPFLPGLAGDNLAYSPDGSSIAWVQSSDRTLWRSRSDGTTRRQLTPALMEAEMPRWSPDGETIAFAGQQGLTGRTRLYRVNSWGGPPEELVPDHLDQANPNWSSDGSTLIFGGAPWRHGFAPESSAIRRFDLRTRQVTTIAGSDGLWAPKLSPDGRFLIAETMDSRSLKLYDFRTGTWSHLGRSNSIMGYPCWSSDSKAVYFNTSGSPPEPPGIYRVTLNNRRIEPITRLSEFSLGGSLWQWFGLTPNDTLLLQRDASIVEIYSIEVNLP